MLLDEEETIDLLEEFEDSLISLVKHATSPYFYNFKDSLQKWINLLSNGKQNLKSCLQTQKRWKLLSSFLKSNALAETFIPKDKTLRLSQNFGLDWQITCETNLLFFNFVLLVVSRPDSTSYADGDRKNVEVSRIVPPKNAHGLSHLFFLSNSDVFQILDAEIDTLTSKSLSLVFHGLKAIKTTPVQKDVSNKMDAVEHVVSINGEILNIPEHYQYNLKPSFLCKNLSILSYTLSLLILEQIQSGVTELSKLNENNVKGQSPFAVSTGALLLQERELLLQSVLTSLKVTWTHQCESILGASARSDSKKRFTIISVLSRR